MPMELKSVTGGPMYGRAGSTHGYDRHDARSATPRVGSSSRHQPRCALYEYRRTGLPPTAVTVQRAAPRRRVALARVLDRWRVRVGGGSARR
jgi:hypothetical protein